MASNKKVSKKKLYACNYDGCSATFKRLIRLKYHIRIHKNEVNSTLILVLCILSTGAKVE